MKRFCSIVWLLIFVLPAAADVVDISGEVTNPNNEIGAGNSARCISNAYFGWQSYDCNIDVDMNGYQFGISSGNGNPLNYSGVISGNGNLWLQSGPQYREDTRDAELIISGSLPNTFSGPTSNSYGVITLAKDADVTAVPGDITIGGNRGGLNGNDKIIWANNNQVDDAATITMQGSLPCWLVLDGCEETVAALVITSTNAVVDTGDGGTLTVAELSVNGEEKPNGAYDSFEPWISGSGQVVVGDIVTPYPPTGVSASDGIYADKVVISWDTMSNATGYAVYRRPVVDTAPPVDISGKIVATAYNDTTAAGGEPYSYWVKAEYGDVWSAFSSGDAGFTSTAIDPPANLQASDGSFPDYVQITWSAVSGATTYVVYRNTVNSYLSALDISGERAATEYNDSDVLPGRVYYYWVKAGDGVNWSFFSSSDSGFIPAELIAYYALDEFEGTNAFDSSDNEFNGYYHENPTLGMNSVAPDLYNSAVGFNLGGGFGLVEIPSNSPIRQLSNNFSVALWVKPADSIGDQVFIGNPQVGVGWIFSSFGGRLKFTTWTITDYVSDSIAVSNGAWTHLAVTMNQGNDVQFYVDGFPFEDIKNGASPANFALISTFLANEGYDAYPYYGVLDEVRVYNGLLSQQEIQDLAAIPEPAFVCAAALLAILTLKRLLNQYTL